MLPTLASAVKQGLFRVGYYGQALAGIRFPGVAVLCYHGVRPDTLTAAFPNQRLHVPESVLDAHCRVIREYCHPISLDDWRRSLAGGPPLPDRPVLVTFDDGYRSVLTSGAPILEQHDLACVVFVCTGPMQSRRRLWFDDAAERDGAAAVEVWKAKDYEAWARAWTDTAACAGDDPLALMTPAELARLAARSGVEIGGHTVSHPILARAPIAVQRREIDDNLQAIREWTGVPVRAFAYPNGRPGLDYTEETVGVLRGAAIETAFTTSPAFACPGEPPLERSRFLMLDDVSPAELAHRLGYSWHRGLQV